MGIRRRDHVYYRGKVWTVGYIIHTFHDYVGILIQRRTGNHSSESLWVRPEDVQRVEQDG